MYEYIKFFGGDNPNGVQSAKFSLREAETFIRYAKHAA